jgi:hypothetical protein
LLRCAALRQLRRLAAACFARHRPRTAATFSGSSALACTKAALFPLQRLPLRGTGRQLCGKRSRPSCTATAVRVVVLVALSFQAVRR